MLRGKSRLDERFRCKRKKEHERKSYDVGIRRETEILAIDRVEYSSVSLFSRE
jgi:hypothetical protein